MILGFEKGTREGDVALKKIQQKVGQWGRLLLGVNMDDTMGKSLCGPLDFDANYFRLTVTTYWYYIARSPSVAARQERPLSYFG